VKKVRKTLKARPGSEDRSTAEGRAIAVCTKSVLQTKGRTLKKVNCSKHILETQPIKAGRRTRKQRNDTIERNKTHVVYVKDDTIKTPPDTERITGLPVGQAGALADICRVNGNETIDANYLTKVPHSAALILFFGKKHEVDILRAKHPLGNLPIEKAKGFAIINLVGDDLEVDALCAHESTRGKGVGANALKFVESMATLNGKKRVLLDALPDAVPFYVKQGYKNTRDNMYAKELAPQTGGLFKWAGADTPVFNNERVGAWNGFPVMLNPNPEQFDGWIAKYNPVVRVVSTGDGELEIHKMLRKMLDDTPPFNQPFVKMHFNLVAEPGAIYPVNFAKTVLEVQRQGGDAKTKEYKEQKLAYVADKFAGSDWFGLVTRTQKSDVFDLDPEPQRNAMCALLRVLLRIDGQIVHADLHRRNMAVMFDGTPVIHDVGRMKVRDADMVGAPPGRVFRDALLDIFKYPNYYLGFSQHFYIARMFKRIRKLHGQTYEAPTITNRERGYRVVYQDPLPSDISMERFKTWLNAPAQMGRDDTNYTQIARVYDILSILKGLSSLPRLNKAKTPALLTANFYARKAAVNLTNHLFGGYAKKENVVNIVRSFLVLSGTNNQCGGRPEYGKPFEAPEDKYAGEYMTPDGGFRDETRGNNKPAPQSAPAPPAPESADLIEVGQLEMALRSKEEDELNKARIESPEGPNASAIKVVTETPPDVQAAAQPPEEENDIEVGAELETRDESIGPPTIRRVEGDARVLLDKAAPSPITGVTQNNDSDGKLIEVPSEGGGRRSFKKGLPRLL
jgi:GNAT superfamily N-acetyltransferase